MAASSARAFEGSEVLAALGDARARTGEARGQNPTGSECRALALALRACLLDFPPKECFEARIKASRRRGPRQCHRRSDGGGSLPLRLFQRFPIRNSGTGMIGWIRRSKTARGPFHLSSLLRSYFTFKSKTLHKNCFILGCILYILKVINIFTVY